MNLSMPQGTIKKWLLPFVLCFSMIFAFFPQSKADAAISGITRVNDQVDFKRYMYTKSFYSNDGHVRLYVKTWGPKTGTFEGGISKNRLPHDYIGNPKRISVNTGGSTYYYDFYAGKAGTYNFNFLNDLYYDEIRQYVQYRVVD